MKCHQIMFYFFYGWTTTILHKFQKLKNYSSDRHLFSVKRDVQRYVTKLAINYFQSFTTTNINLVCVIQKTQTIAQLWSERKRMHHSSNKFFFKFTLNSTESILSNQLSLKVFYEVSCYQSYWMKSLCKQRFLSVITCS